jgi:hypothetical protein
MACSVGAPCPARPSTSIVSSSAARRWLGTAGRARFARSAAPRECQIRRVSGAGMRPYAIGYERVLGLLSQIPGCSLRKEGELLTNLKSISYTANLPGDGLGLGVEPCNPTASTHSSPRARGGLGVEPGASRVLSTQERGPRQRAPSSAGGNHPALGPRKGLGVDTIGRHSAAPRLRLCMRRLAVGFGGAPPTGDLGRSPVGKSVGLSLLAQREAVGSDKVSVLSTSDPVTGSNRCPPTYEMARARARRRAR